MSNLPGPAFSPLTDITISVDRVRHLVTNGSNDIGWRTACGRIGLLFPVVRKRIADIDCESCQEEMANNDY